MRLENLTQRTETELPYLLIQRVSADSPVNDSIDDLTKRVAGEYETLQRPSSDRQMRKFGMDRNEYCAWKLTDYFGGDRFDEHLCEATGRVLGASADEVKDLAREAYRRFSLHYGEEQ